MALTDLFRTGMNVLNQPFVSNVALPGIVSMDSGEGVA